MLFRVLVLLLAGDLENPGSELTVYEGATTFQTQAECDQNRKTVGEAILKVSNAPSGIVLFRCSDKDVPTFLYDEFGIEGATRQDKFPAERPELITSL